MSLAHPFRLEIMFRLVALLKTITPTNGYVLDLSDVAGPEPKPRVYRGRAMFGMDDPVPMISLIEPPVPHDQADVSEDSPYSTGEWPIILQGWTTDDPIHPTDPGAILLADVRKCLTKHRVQNRYALFGLGPQSPDVQGTGNAVLKFDVGIGVVRPPDQISRTAYFWLIIRIMIAENLEKPYG